MLFMPDSFYEECIDENLDDWYFYSPFYFSDFLSDDLFELSFLSSTAYSSIIARERLRTFSS